MIGLETHYFLVECTLNESTVSREKICFIWYGLQSRWIIYSITMLCNSSEQFWYQIIIVNNNVRGFFNGCGYKDNWVWKIAG